MFLTSGIFWGIIIIAAGILILVNQVFKLDLPVFKITFGVFLITLGIFFFADKSPLPTIGNHNTIAFTDKTIMYNDTQQSYDAAFSSTTLDISGLTTSPPHTVKASCAFSSMQIIVPGNCILELDSDVAFGSIDNFHKNPSPDSNSFKLHLKANAAFGKIEILSKQVKEEE